MRGGAPEPIDATTAGIMCGGTPARKGASMAGLGVVVVVVVVVFPVAVAVAVAVAAGSSFPASLGLSAF